MFNAKAVEFELWRVFGAIAMANDKLEPDRQVDFEEIALLFDQIIALTKAVESLIHKPMDRCPVCQRVECLPVEAG
jgi:hypothetical protein